MQQALQQLHQARAGLAKLTNTPPATDFRKRWLARFDALEKEKEDLEVTLAAKSAAFRVFRSQRDLTPSAVGDALPKGAALVDFLHYTHYTPPAKKGGKWLFEKRLLAFVLVKGKEPACVDLGPSEPIDSLVRTWRRYLEAPSLKPAEDTAGPQLVRRVWHPLHKHLEGVRAILISPAGPLCRLPFAALPGSKPGTVLLEEVTLVHLASPRQLLVLQDKAPLPRVVC